MSSPISSLDWKRFFKMFSDRQARFSSGSSELPIEKEDHARYLAKALHPRFQYLIVDRITERSEDTKSYTLVPDKSRGTESLAYFSAGKYLTVFETINDMRVSRPYSVSSSPKNSLEGFYELTIKRVDGGLMSAFILDNWEEGTKVVTSAPCGNFDYQPLRDAETVIGIAGGSGITPFISMANAVVDGDEDFELILLYGSRNENTILFKSELERLSEKTDKIKVIHVLSDPDVQMPDCEKGFITADIIKKYAPEGRDYSIFLCGPQSMYDFVDKEIEKLSLRKKFIRHEMFGEFHDPSSQDDYPTDVPETVKITVKILDDIRIVNGSSNDSVMQILEKNGIAVPSRCRSGECGFCHSHLIEGKVYIPKKMDYRRLADEQFGCIHPCCSFPLTDLVIDIPSP